MKKLAWIILLLLILNCLPAATEAADVAQPTTPPIAFVPNLGQFNRDLRYVADAGDYLLAITETGAAIVPTVNTESSFVRFVQAGSRAVTPTLEGRLPTFHNYYLGEDETRWRSSVPTYSRIVYRGIYPGVDLSYYDEGGRIAYRYDVAAGTDLAAIQLGLAGGYRISVGFEGAGVSTSRGGLHLSPPTASQPSLSGAAVITAGYQTIVESPDYYFQSEKTRFGFHLGDYDHSRPLVITGTFSYELYGEFYPRGEGGERFGPPQPQRTLDLGQQRYQAERACLSDKVEPDPPAVGGERSRSFNCRSVVVVSKFSRAGQQRYRTYLSGGGWPSVSGLSADAAGNAYLTGSTDGDFPLRRPIHRQGSLYVAKLDATGRLVYSTRLGDAHSQALAVDRWGSVYVVGMAERRDPDMAFVTAHTVQDTILGYQADAFALKLNPQGTALIYSTYLGGSESEVANAVAVDAAGSAYITGATYSQYVAHLPSSTGFPTRNPLQRSSGGETDAFVVKLTAAGGVGYATYLGGNGSDSGSGIALDAGGHAWVTGSTSSPDFPTAQPLQAQLATTSTEGVDSNFGDAFVARLSPAGERLLCSSYLGGSNFDEGNAVVAGSDGSIYLAGSTASHDFPLGPEPQRVGEYEMGLVETTDNPAIELLQAKQTVSRHPRRWSEVEVRSFVVRLRSQSSVLPSSGTADRDGLLLVLLGGLLLVVGLWLRSCASLPKSSTARLKPPRNEESRPSPARHSACQPVEQLPLQFVRQELQQAHAYPPPPSSLIMQTL